MKIIQKVRQKIGFATATDLRALKSEIDEIYWGQKFSLLTRDSKWFSSGIYAGGWAVGYPFLCILYRILNEIKPKAILELGLGQSTKLTSAYVNSNIDVRGGGYTVSANTILIG